MKQGLHQVHRGGGTPSLKKAIIAKFKRENGLDYTEKQILVSCGGKQSCFNLCLALLNAGDEVIIPAPYWVSYPDMAMMAGAKPVFIVRRASTRASASPRAARAGDHAEDAAHVPEQPSNPTGAVYTTSDLCARRRCSRSTRASSSAPTTCTSTCCSTARSS
jgi:aspartate aminotransferase